MIDYDNAVRDGITIAVTLSRAGASCDQIEKAAGIEHDDLDLYHQHLRELQQLLNSDLLTLIGCREATV